jgi:branched-subunit amino acid transport protein AzlD
MDALECNMVGIEEILCILDEYALLLPKKSMLQSIVAKTSKGELPNNT